MQVSSGVLRLRQGLDLRAGSFLITFYGDAVALRPRPVWMGSVIDLLQPFGLSPRLVRTSAVRLVADDWLQTTRVGRRSYYGLSDAGRARVERADRRIYDFDLPQWSGRWTLALFDGTMRASTRQQLKRELQWEGFGRLSHDIFAHPNADHRSLGDILSSAEAEQHVAVLSAESLSDYARKPLLAVMNDAFGLVAVAKAWNQFIARFAPMAKELETLSPTETFFVRLLLIHEYRRVLLRDPTLPDAYLPPDWPGLIARQLCATLYRALFATSERFLCARAETPDDRCVGTCSVAGVA